MPYWRLSSMYFLYFGVVGAMTPFWALYLQNRGFEPFYIGLITAAPFIVKLVMPTFWGYIADRTGRYVAVIRLGAFGSAIGFLFIVLATSTLGFWIGLLAFSFFWNAVLSQVDALTISRLGERSSEYGRIRLWGSIGFVCLVFALGWYFDHFAINHLPIILMLIIAALSLSSLTLGDKNTGTKKKVSAMEPGIYQVLMTPDVLVYFTVCFLLQVSLGAYYVFFSVFLTDLGYSKMAISVFWVISVVSEILIFIYMPGIFRRFTLYVLMLVSLVVTVLRWIGTGLFADYWYVLVGLQVMHALTFGVSHSVGMEFVRQRFAKSMFARGQALFITVNYGAGTAVGSALSGALWGFGGVTTFLVSAVAAAAGVILFAWFFRDKQLWKSCVQSNQSS